jgi:hypothetical protein
VKSGDPKWRKELGGESSRSSGLPGRSTIRLDDPFVGLSAIAARTFGLTSPGLEPTNRRRQRHDPQHLDGDVLDGHRRVDNITDPFHQLMKDRYGSEVTKYDDFFFVYALLHSPEYRERYAGELKQMLPASRTFPQRRTTH